MVSGERSLSSKNRISAAEPCRWSVVTFLLWTDRWDRCNATLREGEVLMNGNRIGVDRMAWSRLEKVLDLCHILFKAVFRTGKVSPPFTWIPNFHSVV